MQNKKPEKIRDQPHSYEEDLSNDLDAWFIVFFVLFLAVIGYLLSSKEIWSEILD